MSRKLPRLPIPTRLSQEVADWRRRVATLMGAIAIGVVALVFARAGDLALNLFHRTIGAITGCRSRSRRSSSCSAHG